MRRFYFNDFLMPFFFSRCQYQYCGPIKSLKRQNVKERDRLTFAFTITCDSGNFQLEIESYKLRCAFDFQLLNIFFHVVSDHVFSCKRELINL